MGGLSCIGEDGILEVRHVGMRRKATFGVAHRHHSEGLEKDLDRRASLAAIMKGSFIQQVKEIGDGASREGELRVSERGQSEELLRLLCPRRSVRQGVNHDIRIDHRSQVLPL